MESSVSDRSETSPWAPLGVSETTTHTHFACNLEDPEPSWTLAEVGARIEEAVGFGFPNPVEFEAQYTTLLFDHGNSDCPGGHGDGDDFFHLICTTEEGYTFEGIALRSRTRRVDPGVVIDLWSLSGDFSIGYPAEAYGEGALLRGAGGISSHGVTRAGVLTWFTNWTGSWADTTREGWMKPGISLLLDMTGGVTVDDRRHLSVTGGLAIGQTAMYLDGLGWDESSACLGQTTGTLMIREPSGYWYSWDLGDDCDGCGLVTFSDSMELGELCLDLSFFEETAARVVPGKYTVVVPDTGEVADSGDAP